MTPKEIFEDKIGGKLNDPAQAAAAKEIDAVFQFNLSGDNGGEWVVDLKEGKVFAGGADAADCTISLKGDDFVKLVENPSSATMMFMQGKLKVAGNMGLAMKLPKILG
ncbi:MAG: SCP2 sterol-binding domain-containing protein [Bradymonadia bacterium]